MKKNKIILDEDKAVLLRAHKRIANAVVEVVKNDKSKAKFIIAINRDNTIACHHKSSIITRAVKIMCSINKTMNDCDVKRAIDLVDTSLGTLDNPYLKSSVSKIELKSIINKQNIKV